LKQLRTNLKASMNTAWERRSHEFPRLDPWP